MATVVDSEAVAWDVLRDALNRDLPTTFLNDLTFKTWPRFEVYVPETIVSGSISPLMMQAFLELQTSIYRTQSIYSSGRSDLRSFTDAEREGFEIRVKVEGGSSKYEVDLTEIAKHAITSIAARMKPTHLVVATLGAGLIWGGVDLTSQWVKQNGELRQKQIEGAHQHELTQALEETGKRDSEHEKLWSEALHEVAALKEVQTAVEPARRQVMRALAREPKGGTVNGVRVPVIVAQQVTINERQRSSDTTIRKVFQVARVDTLSPDGFRVTLRDPSTGEMVTAALQDALVSDQHREVIQNAEWRKTLILAEVRGRELRGQLINPVVVDVRAATSEETASLEKALRPSG